MGGRQRVAVRQHWIQMQVVPRNRLRVEGWREGGGNGRQGDSGVQSGALLDPDAVIPVEGLQVQGGREGGRQRARSSQTSAATHPAEYQSPPPLTTLAIISRFSTLASNSTPSLLPANNSNRTLHLPGFKPHTHSPPWLKHVLLKACAVEVDRLVACRNAPQLLGCQVLLRALQQWSRRLQKVHLQCRHRRRQVLLGHGLFDARV